MTNIEFLGLLAGFVSTISFLPQALKVWRTHSTKGISLGMYVIYFIGLILWGVYAWLIESYPLLVTEIVTGILALYILIMKFKEHKS
ncbi:SemiSWEET family sugar transporter [Candidatus Paracaedibacter symbiosus]|uniref:SemiSWEET family sugar transporter n=1 Tax=Candidatus Paracaedibacter symbiosus TaxID=244582 RepID=UPI00050988AE|nr:SemiSWEET transporter [Candidatus Paracaedibacter symbiosus]